jgi:predicted DNA-binding transcriptional regulator AlpA
MELLTVDQLAAFIGKSRNWVSKHCRESTPEERRIPHVRVGDKPRFIKSTIEAWLMANENKPERLQTEGRVIGR